MRYRIVGGTPDPDGTVELPDDAIIIGALYHPVTGELNVVMLVEVKEPKPATKLADEKTSKETIYLGPKKDEKDRKEP